MEEEIDIKINSDGTVQIDMIGYKGEACNINMKKIAQKLGNILQSKKKQDYYDEGKVKISQSN